MNRGQRLKQKKHREALERAKYITKGWERKGGKKTGKESLVYATDMTRVRL